MQPYGTGSKPKRVVWQRRHASTDRGAPVNALCNAHNVPSFIRAHGPKHCDGSRVHARAQVESSNRPSPGQPGVHASRPGQCSRISPSQRTHPSGARSHRRPPRHSHTH